MKRFTVHALAACLAIASSLAGCASERSGHIVIAIDVSDRNEERLLRYADLAFKTQRRLAKVTLITYGHEADIIYQGEPIKDRSRFNRIIGKYLLRPREELKQAGTDQASALVLALRICPSAFDPILVLTDGGSESRSSGFEAALVDHQNVGYRPIYIFGVLPQHRESILAVTSDFNCVVRSLADADTRLIEVSK